MRYMNWSEALIFALKWNFNKFKEISIARLPDGLLVSLLP